MGKVERGGGSAGFSSSPPSFLSSPPMLPPPAPAPSLSSPSPPPPPLLPQPPTQSSSQFWRLFSLTLRLAKLFTPLQLFCSILVFNSMHSNIINAIQYIKFQWIGLPVASVKRILSAGQPLPVLPKKKKNNTRPGSPSSSIPASLSKTIPDLALADRSTPASLCVSQINTCQPSQINTCQPLQINTQACQPSQIDTH